MRASGRDPWLRLVTPGIREQLAPDLIVHEVTGGQRSSNGVPLPAEILSTNRRDHFVAKPNRYAQCEHRRTRSWIRGIIKSWPKICATANWVQTGRFTGGQANLTYSAVTAPVDVDELPR